MRVAGLAVAVALLAGASLPGQARSSAPQDRPTFRATVDRVTLSVTVTDRRGRAVRSLTAGDFELLDSGEPQRILEFERDPAPVSLAILADVSGSMNVANKRAATRAAAQQLVQALAPGEDRVSLYAFDAELTEVQPLEPAPGQALARLDALAPWGRTSLFDAIAETGRRLAATEAPRRAVVVLTDGDDNASLLTAPEVSGIASSIDVPVFVLVVVSPLDRIGRSGASLIDPHLTEQRMGALGNLARWTGGDIATPVAPNDVAATARRIVSDLRQQYLIGFEPRRQPGWHPLELRTRQSNLTVRARSGYIIRNAALDRH